MHSISNPFTMYCHQIHVNHKKKEINLVNIYLFLNEMKFELQKAKKFVPKTQHDVCIYFRSKPICKIRFT